MGLLHAWPKYSETPGKKVLCVPCQNTGHLVDKFSLTARLHRATKISCSLRASPA